MSFEPKHDPRPRPERKHPNLDFFIWVAAICVVIVLFGSPFVTR